MNAEAIMEELNRSNEKLTLWVTKDILRIANSNSALASRKGFWLKLSIFLFMIGTVLLAFSLAA